MPSSKTRIAIIGGGVAGLVVARHMVSRLDIYSLMLFEQTDHIGGTWVYTDETHLDKHGLLIHSSMYKNLRTNIPKEIMQIPDFPFKNQGGPSFAHHSLIREYLLDYAKQFNLYPYIKLNTLVKNVEPEILKNGQTLWTVTYKDLESKVETTKTFDAVVLCNGHYTIGHVPHTPGIESFHGECIHSHQYRMPEIYAGKKVCILGASWSGIDIAMEVSQYADKVYLSHNWTEHFNSKMSSNVEQRPNIESIQGNVFIFRDGSSAEVDSFIYCTGYKFTYPFMSTKVEIRTDDNHVEPIYKHLVHMDYTSLFFMGLPAIVVPFPMFHIQAQYILAVLEGRIQLPSPQRMREEYEIEKKSLLEQGIQLRHINKLKDRQWAYYDEIAAAANVPSFPPVIRKIFDHVSDMRDINFTTYKNYQYCIIDNENFSVSYCKPC
ncbi:flavin-containing monooxygenase FMO GS-OX3-like [Formica exsecta]|uniref:flavin-containing monooxygenase FMO GS-OX3-like n=2 Tax=Formica exsecta TaxID=72781 RepID=UPI0011412F7C|nr:flavin-containing monooxygenase FMO GS-OX3-like [Formica exsecta]XP_029661262.1 flavin-containing monooxygenase FMO GS-OX3-like [Formica exsecta]XP_029661263.1 flavin-containing monooxygenase FMO GS-OX3-like [Formica exsecta]XP_029661265.1 flavin-containing monooxygenase FMO GS-OX3-like [Formica exsecta]XP_029661266.1 flavin-containing monooxygenase FMO GS-OX3-like [Formica exsecta]XP_029661267.1 flavin-containing monooxygenase FMO GS-OX3-like [Formica exsecta]XP_029661429.1 flavin-contain